MTATPSMVGFIRPLVDREGTNDQLQWSRQNLAVMVRTIYAEAQDRQPAAVTESDLGSYSIPANMCAQTTEGFEVFACGSYAANGNNKTIKGYFGGTSCISTGVLAANATLWGIFMKVIRNSAQGFLVFAHGYANGAIITPTITTLTGIDPTAAIITKYTATCPSAITDTTQKFFDVKFLDQFNFTING